MLNKKRWLLQSVIALLLVGAGLCICIDAGVAKYAMQKWFFQGSLGLIIFNTGLCVAIDASKHR
jgi:ribosomal protein L21E